MLAIFLLAQLAPLPPRSALETPAMQAAASLAASTAAAPKDWLTHAETSNYRETGRYAEAVALYQRLAQASPYARLESIGVSGEGRPLYALIVSRDKAFTPAAARRAAKPVVLLQNGIHAGENGGKDAAIMLLRDILVTKRKAAWLDHVILLSIPVFNADGHEHLSGYNRINENGPREMGFRVTAQRLNLNRDYIKADAPEMRAWLRLFNAWLPDFLLDNHVTDGSDNQWDVTIATHSGPDIAAPMGQWVENSYLKPMLAAMDKWGHLTGWYAGGRGGAQGAMAASAFSARYSTGYAAAHNRAALLVETHSLKEFKTRVWSHYDIMAASLDAIAAAPAALLRASRDSDAAMAALKPGDSLALDTRPAGGGEPYTLRLLESERYTGAASGAPVTRYTSRPVNTETRLIRAQEPRTEIRVPLGYIVPRPWQSVIELLALHGVRSEPLPREISATFDTLRFDKVQFATTPFEGRIQVTSFSTRTVTESRTLPAGSLYYPVAQPAGRVLVHLLEPDGPDSAVRWGFFHSIFEQKEYFSDYVFEPWAAEWLKQDPKIRAEFEAALAADPALAKNPRARLAWLYARSPYFEPDKDAYPVVRVNAKSW